MKKKIALYVLTGLFLFGGCSKDSEDTSTNPSGVDKSGNLLTTGISASDFLSNDKFDKLLIEVAFVAGFQPSFEAMANFEEFLRARTFKENIDFRYTTLNSPFEETLTLDEVDNLEKENRNAYNDGSTLALYIYFADAPSDSDNEAAGTVTLGAVYRNTSMVVYEQTVRNLANRSNSLRVEDVETATLLHETGHLFGLVGLSTSPVNNHEDPDAENHCNVAGCLMRAEIQFGTSLLKIMQDNASKGTSVVPDFDAECLLDLQKYGGR